jgi:vacuolar protein sorting-associated protein 45
MFDIDVIPVFSNLVSEEQLKLIAEADVHCLVREVQEFYADFHALEANLFSLDIDEFRPFYQDARNGSPALDRTVSGIISCLLAHKRRPVIRYPAGSDACRYVASGIASRMDKEKELFHFQQRSPPLLLILDRRDDPLTPLLSQWTYQAMVHDLLGISKNRIDLRSVPDIKQELREVVLAPHQDEFFQEAMYLNFGELGVKLKALVSAFQTQKNNQSKLNSIEDMQRVVEAMPEFKRASGNVSKHVSLTSEIARLVEVRRLMSVSEVEQDMACQDDPSTHLEMCLRLIDDPLVQFFEKLRLVLIYSLRYENNRNQIEQFARILSDRASGPEQRRMVQTFMCQNILRLTSRPHQHSALDIIAR